MYFLNDFSILPMQSILILILYIFKSKFNKYIHFFKKNKSFSILVEVKKYNFYRKNAALNFLLKKERGWGWYFVLLLLFFSIFRGRGDLFFVCYQKLTWILVVLNVDSRFIHYFDIHGRCGYTYIKQKVLKRKIKFLNWQ